MKIKNYYNLEDKNINEVLTKINKCDYGVLSMVTEQKPYAIPLSFVIAGRDIYFHCGLNGKKIQIINDNPNVCFNIVAHSNNIYKDDFTVLFHSYLIEGLIEEVVVNSRS